MVCVWSVPGAAEGLTVLIGADQAGNLVEIGVVDSDEGPVVVHAMPARDRYLR